MRRPTLIVAEPEPGQALSTRKLVLETAKFNVLTAHSTDEALDVFQSFPNATCVIAVEDETINCERILKFVRTVREDILLIALSPRHGFKCGSANHHLSSHDPESLVQLVRSLLGDPRKMDPDPFAKRGMSRTALWGGVGFFGVAPALNERDQPA